MAQLAITIGVSVGVGLVQSLFAKKQKTPPTDKGRYDDIRVQGSDYGAFIPYLTGQMRLAPQIIFSGGIGHFVRTSGGGSGGKGGGGSPTQGTVNEHIYLTTIGLLVCANEIEEFQRIWADADSLYATGDPTSARLEAEEATRSGGASLVTGDATASNDAYVTNLGNGGKIVFNTSSAANYTPIDPEDPDPHDPIEVIHTRLEIYYKSPSARTAQITFGGTTVETVEFPASSVWAVSEISVVGSHTAIEVANPSAAAPDIDYINVSYFRAAADDYRRPKVTGIVNPNVDYPVNLDDPSAYYNFTPEKDSGGDSLAATSIPAQAFRFYTGTETQMPDPAYVGWLDTKYGPGNGIKYASAFRGLAYIILENYVIPNGRVPNFTVEVKEGSRSLIAVLTQLYERSGIPASRLELSALIGLKLAGSVIYQFTPAAQTIRQLEAWFSFSMIDADGKYRAILESAAPVGSIEAINLRAHEFGEEMPDFDAEIKSGEEQSAPLVSIVNFMNKSLDYHNEAAEDRLYGSTSAKETLTQSFPFVAAPDEARQVATKDLLKKHLELKTFYFEAMPHCARYAPGDRINLQLPTRTYDVRIKKKQMALPGKVKFEGVLADSEIYNNEEISATNSLTDSPLQRIQAAPTYPRNSKLLLIESIGLIEEHRGELGIYMAVSGRGTGVWNGAEIQKEIADGIFETISVANAPSPIGLAQSTLGNFSNPDIIDESQITIYFYDAIEMETVSESELDSPATNLIRIGREWVQFQIADAVALPDQSIYRSAWQISNFRRGRFGTRNRIATHTADEFCAVVTSALKWRRLEPNEIDTELAFKAVTFGQAAEVAPVEYVTVVGESVKSIAVIQTPFDLTDSDTRLLFTNAAADELIEFDLPPVKRGSVYKFLVSEAGGISVQPNAKERIRLGAFDTTDEVYSQTVGSYLTLRGDEDFWFAEDIEGDWAAV